MSTADDQRKNVAEFHALTEQTEGLTLEEWRKTEAGWKSRMSVWVKVGHLRALLARLEAAESKLQSFQQAETMIPPPSDSWADWYMSADVPVPVRGKLKP